MKQGDIVPYQNPLKLFYFALRGHGSFHSVIILKTNEQKQENQNFKYKCKSSRTAKRIMKKNIEKLVFRNFET